MHIRCWRSVLELLQPPVASLMDVSIHTDILFFSPCQIANLRLLASTYFHEPASLPHDPAGMQAFWACLEIACRGGIPAAFLTRFFGPPSSSTVSDNRICLDIKPWWADDFIASYTKHHTQQSQHVFRHTLGSPILGHRTCTICKLTHSHPVHSHSHWRLLCIPPVFLLVAMPKLRLGTNCWSDTFQDQIKLQSFDDIAWSMSGGFCPPLLA